MKSGDVVVINPDVSSDGEPIGGIRLRVTSAYRRDDWRLWLVGVDDRGRRYSLPQDVVSLCGGRKFAS